MKYDKFFLVCLVLVATVGLFGASLVSADDTIVCTYAKDHKACSYCCSRNNMTISRAGFTMMIPTCVCQEK